MRECNCDLKAISVKKIPLDCPRTYDFLATGLTTGVFQLESYLGKRFCAAIKPKNIREIADVISLIRPGTLDATDDNNNKLIDVYIKVKNKEQEPFYLHPSLEKILNKTYSVAVYQEQLLEIARDIVGFNLINADHLRKAIGKKLPEEMAKWKDEFINGCQKTSNIPLNDAEKLWSWYEAAAGYNFNLAHAIGYALTGYRMAWLKCHIPVYFFKSMLKYAMSDAEKQDELFRLIYDAKLWDINVLPPNIKRKNYDFEIIDKNNIIFGLSAIKDIGKSVQKSINVFSELKDFQQVIDKSRNINKKVIEALVFSGAFDCFIDNNFSDRRKMWAALMKNRIFTDKEIDTPSKKISQRRENTIKKEVDDLQNMAQTIDLVAKEENYLSIVVSNNGLGIDFAVKHNCKDVLNLPPGSEVVVGVTVKEVFFTVTKRGEDVGKPIAILKGYDDYYCLDSLLIFGDLVAMYEPILKEGNKLIIFGRKNKTSSVSVKKIIKFK